MISGINEKKLSKKYPVKVRPFPGASANDMDHYLRPLLQKCPDTIIVGTNNCVNESSHFVLEKIFKTFIQNSLPQCKVISNVINRTNDGKASLTMENLNNHLNSLIRDIVDNSIICKVCPFRKGLYLTKRRSGKLAVSIFIK